MLAFKDDFNDLVHRLSRFAHGRREPAHAIACRIFIMHAQIIIGDLWRDSHGLFFTKIGLLHEATRLTLPYYTAVGCEPDM